MRVYIRGKGLASEITVYHPNQNGAVRRKIMENDGKIGVNQWIWGISYFQTKPYEQKKQILEFRARNYGTSYDTTVARDHYPTASHFSMIPSCRIFRHPPNADIIR